MCSVGQFLILWRGEEAIGSLHCISRSWCKLGSLLSLVPFKLPPVTLLFLQHLPAPAHAAVGPLAHKVLLFLLPGASSSEPG